MTHAAPAVLNMGQNYRMTGGSDRYMLQLEALLRNAGVEVIPFAAAHPDNLPTPWSEYFPPQVDFSSPGASDLLRYVYNHEGKRRLESLLDTRLPDLAHLHIYYGQLSASILAPLRRRDIPVVQTLHEYKLICPTYSLFADGAICEACKGGRFYNAISRRCNRNSLARSALSAVETYASHLLGAERYIDHFIAVSDFLRNKMIEHGVAADKVTTVHNFIDANVVQPACDDGDYVLFLGRIERIKGIRTLLAAVEPLSDIRLVVAGDGGDREVVREAQARLGPERVDWRGFVRGPALGDLIRGARFLVAPSEWYETFGLILIEAFAHGRPVVSARSGGMTEVVEEGVDGLLFDPGNVEQLRDAIETLWAQPARAREMGMQGRTKVRKKFSPAFHFERLREVYRRVGLAL